MEFVAAMKHQAITLTNTGVHERSGGEGTTIDNKLTINSSVCFGSTSDLQNINLDNKISILKCKGEYILNAGADGQEKVIIARQVEKKVPLIVHIADGSDFLKVIMHKFDTISLIFVDGNWFITSSYGCIITV